ncbi:MAG: putative toxin-antitoxin system toxin component, PIN family [Oscillospiraceae bacterium]|nr:putative toxin-antitoxin system toxin component, PIN family [Oscillospiraceae bacterium]
MTYYIIIDTNVIISAMLKKNTPPSEILKEVFSGNVIPVVNDEILKEYREVLSRKKFGFDPETIQIILNELEKKAVFSDRLSADVSEMPDKDDIVFYEVTLYMRQSEETFLVSGNLKHFPQKPFIVSPREFLEILRGNQNEQTNQ